MGHNDAINNKQSSFREACKLFVPSGSFKDSMPKISLGHKSCTQNYAAHTQLGVELSFRVESGKVGKCRGFVAAKKFRCLCEINCWPRAHSFVPALEAIFKPKQSYHLHAGQGLVQGSRSSETGHTKFN